MLVRATDLTRRAAGHAFIEGVHLELGEGECLAIAGSVAGGRRTLLRLLATILRPTGGELTIAGIDAVASPLAARGQVMFVAADAVHGDSLTAREYLAFVAVARGVRRYGAARLAAALAAADVDGAAYVTALSSIARSRLALAAAVFATPAVALIEQPASGPDTTWDGAVSACITALRNEGTAIVIGLDASDGVPAVCDTAMTVEGGRVLSVSKLLGVRAEDERLSPAGEGR